MKNDIKTGSLGQLNRERQPNRFILFLVIDLNQILTIRKEKMIKILSRAILVLSFISFCSSALREFFRCENNEQILNVPLQRHRSKFVRKIRQILQNALKTLWNR